MSNMISIGISRRQRISSEMERFFVDRIQAKERKRKKRGKKIGLLKEKEDTIFVDQIPSNFLFMSHDPSLPADFDPIAMGVEDLPEPQEDSGDLDDDSDDFIDEIESATCLEDQMTLCLNNF